MQTGQDDPLSTSPASTIGDGPAYGKAARGTKNGAKNAPVRLDFTFALG
jgi:hypothetical protein